MNQLQTLKGFRDFLPEEKRKRDWVIAKIKQAFELYGFEPLETPTLEYASLLLGKYGAEADKLVYQFKDRGDRDIALRYDQTVPTARVLAQNQNPEQLPKIMRRYQIQNVFRADKPQKGRFREFTQCDADIFVSNHPLSDAELLAVFYESYKQLNLTSLVIKINDRRTLLETLKPFETDTVSIFSIVQSVDKLDKQTVDEVTDELVAKGLQRQSAQKALSEIQNAKASEALQTIMEYAKKLGVPESALQFTPTLARGLDYYTGMIFEGIIPQYTAGSIGGGGRYDNLIKDLSGVHVAAAGFAIGFDRTVEAVGELNLFPETILSPSSKVLVCVMDETVDQSIQLVRKLRSQKIAGELFGTPAKLDKQLKYASVKKIPFVVILGPDEVKNETVTVKNMNTGTQKTVSLEQLIEIVSDKQ